MIFIWKQKKLAAHSFYEDILTPNYFVCKDISHGSFTVDYNGKIRSCSKLYTDNVIGYINEHGKIKLNDMYNTFSLKTNIACSCCEYEPLCHGKGCGLKNICDKENIKIIVGEYLKKAARLNQIPIV